MCSLHLFDAVEAKECSILSVLKSSVTILVLLATIAVPAHATVTTTGDVDPGGAAVQSDPWSVGILYVGRNASGTLDVTDGGVVSNRDGVLSDYGDSSVDAGNRSRNRSKYT